MHARVWAAGGVKVNMQQINSNFQDSDNLWLIINGEVGRAVSGLASKLWVPGRAGMHGRPLLSP